MKLLFACVLAVAVWIGAAPTAYAAADVETSTRLWLKALAASDVGRGVKLGTALHERVTRLLDNPAASRAQMDVLSNGAAGYALGRTGLWADNETLLKSKLARSHSPYYLMSQLGSNAHKLGRKKEALRWYAEAFDKSQGPANKLQSGAGYLCALVDLAAQDAARIERTAWAILAEAGLDSGAFDGRDVRSLQRGSTQLLSWNADGQRAACKALLKPAAKKPLSA
jgi:hypothetical protein